MSYKIRYDSKKCNAMYSGVGSFESSPSTLVGGRGGVKLRVLNMRSGWATCKHSKKGK